MMEIRDRAILQLALLHLYDQLEDLYDVTAHQIEALIPMRHGPFRASWGMLYPIPDLDLSAPQLAARINWALRYITLHPGWPWPPPAQNTARMRQADEALQAAVSMAVRGAT